MSEPKTRAMRTDVQNISNGVRVQLFPNADNPLHKKPFFAYYSGGFFYGEMSNPMDGPDYYLGDVLLYNDGFIVSESNDG